jgi:uncharacterized repeat protein (TIGR03803 family)
MKNYLSRILPMAVAAITLTLAATASAQYTETQNVYTFPGLYPNSPVTMDPAGNLYGSLGQGGAGNCLPFGCGVVYQLPPGAQSAVTAYGFTGLADGGGAQGRIIADAKGNLYGVGSFGGNVSACGGQGCGVVYELSSNADGTFSESVLYAFAGGSDGVDPVGVAFDGKGNLFGATAYGGSSTCSVFGNQGCGIVFELSPNANGGWTETILYTFNGAGDGSVPAGAVTLDAKGNVFGSAAFGGTISSICTLGCGTIFRLSPKQGGTWTFSRVYDFTFPRGAGPAGELAIDSAGNLYGVTVGGGRGLSACSFNSCGTVFELENVSKGTYRQLLLHAFTGGPDGANPNASVILDAAGNVYGTAGFGGPSICSFGCGTVYKLSPASGGGWIFHRLYGFTGFDGADPDGDLIMDATGNLYGTTVSGAQSYGNIFELSPPAASNKKNVD